MHSVVLTRTFLSDAKAAGMDEDEMLEIVAAVAASPESGDVMVGSGGARKLRHAGRGRGKSGGYRTIHYFGGGDIPVFLLAVFGKGDKDNLTKAERNQLAILLPTLVATYGRGRT